MNCAGAALLMSIVGLGTAAAWPAAARSQAAASSEVLDVRSGALTLRAQVWRPWVAGHFRPCCSITAATAQDEPRAIAFEPFDRLGVSGSAAASRMDGCITDAEREPYRAQIS